MNAHPNTTRRSETIISSTILVLLAVIAAGLFMAQNRFNPAVDLVDSPPRLLGDDAAPEDPGHESIIGDNDALNPLTAPEQFDRQTLSDKINGKAELYLSAGFLELISQRFSVPGVTDTWFEVFIYDMGNPDNAFAVFSMQQREDAVPVDLGSNAYHTQNALFWVHGRYYGEVIGSTASPAVLKAMQQATRAFMSKKTVKSARFDPVALFPGNDLTTDSITLIPADAFGFHRMDQVYTAEFQFEDRPLTAYVSKRPDPEAARQLMQAYVEFLTDFGGQPMPQKQPDPNVRIISLMGAHEIVFNSGPYVAGVHDAVDLQNALKLALDMKKHLERQ